MSTDFLLKTAKIVELDKDFNVVPGAAESWEVSEDGKTWLFHLREGQVWSDGTPLTIDDVKFSFDCVFDPRYPCSIQDGFRNEKGTGGRAAGA